MGAVYNVFHPSQSGIEGFMLSKNDNKAGNMLWWNSEGEASDSMLKGKPSRENMFATGYESFQEAKTSLDKSLTDLVQSYSVLAQRRRLLEQAQQAASWEYRIRCRPLVQLTEYDLPCEKLHQEMNHEYHQHQHPPTCAVGASLALRPASFHADIDRGRARAFI